MRWGDKREGSVPLHDHIDRSQCFDWLILLSHDSPHGAVRPLLSIQVIRFPGLRRMESSPLLAL